MLDGNHYKTAELVDQLISNAQMKAIYDIIECLKPTLRIAKNEKGETLYVYDYSDGIILASGSTIHEAMMAFSGKYYNQKGDPL